MVFQAQIGVVVRLLVHVIKEEATAIVILNVLDLLHADLTIV